MRSKKRRSPPAYPVERVPLRRRLRALLVRPEFRRAVLFGAGITVATLALYAAFELATGLDPGLLGAAAGYLLGRAIQIGARGARGDEYGGLAVALLIAGALLSRLPVELWRAAPDAQWWWIVAKSIGGRAVGLFASDRIADVGAFLQVSSALLSVVAGAFIARVMNE